MLGIGYEVSEDKLVSQTSAEKRRLAPDSFLQNRKEEKFAASAMCFVIAYAAIRNVVAAAAKPFWFDELCSVIISRQPHISGIWKALAAGADGQPPLFYVIERAASHLASNELIAYRLPSLFAFCLTLWCMFVFIRKRDGGLTALICSSLLMLTIAGTYYAVEARPYDLVVACVACALVCYQRADRTAWVIALALSLAAAESLHYFAIFAVIPFGAAELATTASGRKWRWQVWAAFCAPLLSVLVTLPLQMKLKETYGGSHVEHSPHFRSAAGAYSEFFGIPSIRYFPYAGRASVALLLLFFLGILIHSLWIALKRNRSEDSFQSELIAVMLFTLPLIVAAATEFERSKFAERYVLETILGLPLAAAFVLRFMSRFKLIVALAFLLLFTSISQEEFFFWQSQAGHLWHAPNPALPMADLVNSAGHDDLPVVVSDGGQYLAMAYYAPAEMKTRLMVLVDATQSAKLVGTDNVDVELAALANYHPLKVVQFRDFAASRREALLYSNGGEWDWWPKRLAVDHDSLEMIAGTGSQRLYLLTLRTTAY